MSQGESTASLLFKDTLLLCYLPCSLPISGQGCCPSFSQTNETDPLCIRDLKYVTRFATDPISFFKYHAQALCDKQENVSHPSHQLH